MAYKCTNCTFIESSIKDLCRHLRENHSLYEGSQLKLKCCFSNCPLFFKTYSGFRRHIVKCKFNTEQNCTINSCNNSTETLPSDITHNIEKNSDAKYSIDNINVPNITIDDNSILMILLKTSMIVMSMIVCQFLYRIYILVVYLIHRLIKYCNVYHNL